MAKNKINAYMYLLRLSKKYIKQAIEDYDSKKSKLDNYHELYYKIDYHMFTFTQLVYAIKDRLKNKYPKDEDKIEKFFNSPIKITAAVKQLANYLKHRSTNLIDTTNLIVELDEKEKTSKVKEIKTDRIVNSKNLILKNKNLSGLFEDAYKELSNFLDSMNYDY